MRCFVVYGAFPDLILKPLGGFVKIGLFLALVR